MHGMSRSSSSGKAWMFDGVRPIDKKPARFEGLTNIREEFALKKEEDCDEVKRCAAKISECRIFIAYLDQEPTFRTFDLSTLHSHIRNVEYTYIPALLREENRVSPRASSKIKRAAFASLGNESLNIIAMRAHEKRIWLH